jgi:hypothetical protein
VKERLMIVSKRNVSAGVVTSGSSRRPQTSIDHKPALPLQPDSALEGAFPLLCLQSPLFSLVTYSVRFEDGCLLGCSAV